MGAGGAAKRESSDSSSYSAKPEGAAPNWAEKCVASSVQNTSRIYLDKLNFIYSNQDLVKLQLYLVHKVCTITLTVHFFAITLHL